jgi:hypothetical protein
VSDAGACLRVGTLATIAKGGRDQANEGGNAVNGPRAADDFATIRARLEELRREREQANPCGKNVQPDLPLPRDGNIRWPLSDTNAGPGRVPTSGPGTHLSSVWDL